MQTTTIRVDIETHRRLQEIGRRERRQLIDVVRDAAEALERSLFADRVTAELGALRADVAAWESYLADAEALPVNDGIS